MSDLAPPVRPAFAAFQRGELSEAERLCREAIAGDERCADAYQLLATIHLRHGRHQDALVCYDEALALRPDDLTALCNRAVALAEFGRHEEALASCDKALALRPDYLPALANRGNALRALRRFDEALAAYDEALALSPKFPEALSNRGTTLHNLQRYAEAVESHDRALTLRPDYSQALSNRGLALQRLGRFAEALASYDKALSLNAAYPDCHINKAQLLLLLGRFREGWREYEWRRQTRNWAPRSFAAPEWRGDELRGRRLLLYAEQGLSETIQFVRFARLFASRGAEVTLEVPPALARLMQGVAGAARTVSQGEPCPAGHYHLPLASVPFALGLDEAQIPTGIPYLQVEPSLVQEWAARLPVAEFRIGVAWQADAQGDADDNSSIPLAAFARLAQIPGVRLIGLQKHDAEQLVEYPEALQKDAFGEAFDAAPDPLLAAAAAMMQLDLIVTGENALADLAGALGRPVWIALRDVPDWRWLLERADSPWYPTARLFRQTAAGDWESVFARIAEAAIPLVVQKKNATALPPPSPTSAADAAGIPGFAISLARRPDRRERFLRWNAGKGIDLTIFDAVDGRTLNKQQLLRANIIDNENINFTMGFLGSAMSHRGLWEKCIALGLPILIFEDDVFIPDTLRDWLEPALAELASGCDILFLGYNRDAILSVGYGGGAWCNIQFETPTAGFEYEAQQHSRWSRRTSHSILDTRLVWGITAYIVSPASAASLLRHCFPLSNKLPVRMFGANRMLIPYGLDGMINVAVQRGLIKARVVFPPLVIGPNEQTDSDNYVKPSPS